MQQFVRRREDREKLPDRQSNGGKRLTQRGNLTSWAEQFAALFATGGTESHQNESTQKSASCPVRVQFSISATDKFKLFLPQAHKFASGTVNRIRLGERHTGNVLIGGRPLGSFAVAEIPGLTPRVRADDSEVHAAA